MPKQSHVRAEQVTVTRGGRRLLNDINVSVSPRTRLALVGENGRGKTTLLQVLSGVLAPDDGQVLRSGTIGVVDQSLAARNGETVQGSD